MVSDAPCITQHLPGIQSKWFEETRRALQYCMCWAPLRFSSAHNVRICHFSLSCFIPKWIYSRDIYCINLCIKGQCLGWCYIFILHMSGLWFGDASVVIIVNGNKCQCHSYGNTAKLLEVVRSHLKDQWEPGGIFPPSVSDKWRNQETCWEDLKHCNIS